MIIKIKERLHHLCQLKLITNWVFLESYNVSDVNYILQSRYKALQHRIKKLMITWSVGVHGVVSGVVALVVDASDFRVQVNSFLKIDADQVVAEIRKL